MAYLWACNGVHMCVWVWFSQRGNMCKVPEQRKWMAFKELNEIQSHLNIEFEGLFIIYCYVANHLKFQHLLNIKVRRTRIQTTVKFSSKTTEILREWNNIFKVLKGKNYQPRIQYPAKISFRNENKMKAFSDEEKPTERICHQQTYSKNKCYSKFFRLQENYTRNLKLQEWRKSNKNGK